MGVADLPFTISLTPLSPIDDLPRRFLPTMSAAVAEAPTDLLLSLGTQQEPVEEGAGAGAHDALLLLNQIATLKDGNTAHHVVRMAHIAACLAQQLGLDVRRIDMLLQAAPLHDIGKIAIPDAILKKAGPLSADEMTVMRTHARVGHDLLARTQSMTLRLGAEIALNHHERWDGTGYPSGLSGERIPLSARIVAVADVFDALTSERPYKSAWSFDDALTHMESEAGQHFDPTVLACLRPCMARIRTIVELFS